MKIVVFGGAGFLGSHVADCLTAAGHAVTIYDLKESPYLQAGQEMIVGDILDREKVKAAVAGVEVVYNFAGYADIGEAQENPVAAIDANVMGNTYIMDACVQHQVKRYLLASTLYVYSNKGSFYRCTKQCCELIAEAYHERYALEYTILRFGSLYGPRADRSNWIYTILQDAIREGRIERAGDGEEVREYIHVDDAARASVTVLAPEYVNQYVLLTGETKLKIKELLAMIREMFENRIEIVYDESAMLESHYEITPYVFKPRVGKKLVVNPRIELGQGLLDLLYQINQKFVPEGENK